LLLPLRAGAWRALPASVLPYTFLWALLVAALVGLGPKVGKVGKVGTCFDIRIPAKDTCEGRTLRDLYCTLLQGVIIPKHFLEYSALTGESANTTLGFC
jgi:hypothetical protein